MDKKQEILDYIELMNGSRLYLLPVTQADMAGKSLEAEKEFEATTGKLEQPWYWTVEPDDKGRGGERALWTKKDVEKDGTDEEKAAWRAYEANQAQLNAFIEDKVFKFILGDGTSKLVTRAGNELDLVIDPVTYEWTPPENWLKRQNGNAPADPYELKFLFLSPMIKDVETKRKIVSRCNLLNLRGVVTEEDLLKYDSIFRRAMAQVAEGFDAGPEGTEAGYETGGQALLDLQLPEVGEPGQEIQWPDSVAVGQPE